MNDSFDVRKELDAVIESYDEGRGERFLRRYGRLLGRAVAFMTLAIAAAGLVFFILHKHVTDARKAPPPKKPVSVQIVPSRP